MRAAQNSAALSERQLSDEARGVFLPNLTASTTGARNYGRNFDQTAGQVVNQTTTSASLGVNTGVVLFDGLGNVAQLRGAKLDAAASGEELRRARETVAFDVATSFLALIQRQEQLRVQRENLQAVYAAGEPDPDVRRQRRAHDRRSLSAAGERRERALRGGRRRAHRRSSRRWI